MGRAESVDPWVELVGNDPCLDFLNTVNDWDEPAADQFDSPDRFSAWASLAGLPPIGTGADATSHWRRARRLRESLRQVLSAAIDGAPHPAEHGRVLLDAYAEAFRRASLEVDGERLRPVWPPDDAAAAIWEVADSAVRLLRSGRLDRVGRCPSCGWFFLDTTRNRSRRWCSMATCGNRHKALRYHERHRT